MTIELTRAFGVFSAAGVPVEPPAPAADGNLEMVHLQRYIAAVRQAGDPEPDPAVLDFGPGTEDNPVIAGMHDASALVAGATLAAARGRCGRVRRSTARASPTACIMRCAPARAGSE
jgi:acetoin utilization protein AcuC